MVSVKLNGTNSLYRNHNYHNSNHHSSHYCCWNSSHRTTTATAIATNTTTNPSSLPHQQPQRILVSILLTTFVFITMFIPIMRFVRYDDSHLFQSILLLDQQHLLANTVVSSSTESTSTNAAAATTLMDVALGKAPLSDYIQSSSSSSQSATTTETMESSERNHNDPSSSKQLLQPLLRITPGIGIGTNGGGSSMNEKGEGNVSNKYKRDHNQQENTDETKDGGRVEEEDVTDEEDHVIQPSQRTITPFSWENQLIDANNYIQSFTHVGRSTTLPVMSNNNQVKNKKRSSAPPPQVLHHDSLLFFHIPKTAGTAIEYAAGSNKDVPLAWGSCRFNHKPKRDICHYPKHSKIWPQYVGWWHLPVQLFPIANNNPYENAELFGVVRDPYDRMVSEFYYICTLKVFSWRPDQCDRSQLSNVTYMNEWLSNKIRNREMDSGQSYLIDNGHFTPQYDYIFGPNQVRMLDYVLFMDSEHFNDDFQTLMNAYELPNVQLKKLNALGATARDDTHLDTSHLDTKTIQWIHNMYPDDFTLGGYQKKSNR